MNDYEKTLSAMPRGRARGHADIAIDFATQIFGFPDYRISRLICVSYIYESEMYDIVSFADPIGQINPETGEVEMKGSFYSTGDIYVVKGEKEELLDDYAYNFIIKASAEDNIFESKDFLTQVCVTHAIHCLQTWQAEIEPFNMFTRIRRERLQKLESAFLELFRPWKEKISNYAFKKWKSVIDYCDIHSRALLIVRSMVSGDDKKIIGDVLASYNQNPSGNKSVLRSLDREMRIHPFSTHTGKKNTDIKNTFHQNINYLFNLLLAKSSIGSPIAGTLAQLLLEPDARFSLVTGGLNRNSERVYFPNSKISVVDFIFGKKRSGRSRIMRYLCDSFRTEKNREKKRTQFNDEYQYEFLPIPPRRWKKNDISKYSEEELGQLKKEAEEILSGVLLETYNDFLCGRYDSTNKKQRQRLSRARRKILKEKNSNTKN